MKKIIFLLIIIQLVSCGRWKTTKLKPEQVLSINSGSNAGDIMLEFDKDDILDISFRLSINQGSVFTSDNLLKRVQALDMSGNPLLFIGQKSKKLKIDSRIKKSYFNFSIIGLTAVDSEDKIYIQNRFTSTTEKNESSNGRKSGFSPSYILVFDKEGNLLYTLGKRGTPEIPFNFIEHMEIDNEDRLFVITRSYDTWDVLIFKDKKRSHEINFGEVDFRTNDDDNEIAGKIENILIYNNGENLLLSIAHYHDSEFKYRRLYSYNIINKKIDRTVMKIPDPQNELFTVIDNKHIYLWDIGERDVKFVICNFNGNIINNIILKLPETHDYFRDILIDDNEQLYSYHVDRKSIKLLRWR